MFSASDVKALREKTGAGMLDCKKALEESKGNIDVACDWLREKGIAKAQKKGDRIAALGLAQTFVDGNKAVILEINSETDFVAKNEVFKNMVEKIGKAILESGVCSDKEAMNLVVDSQTISDLITSVSARLGEKISFRRFVAVTKDDNSVFGDYIHMGGKIAAITIISGNDQEVARDVAMHAAAMRPLYVFETDVPANILEREKEIMKTSLINEGKPADKLDNILVGKVKKYYEEVCLNNQIFIKSENKETVSKYLEKNNSKLINMVRFEVGEGIEKRVDNFAEEVMNQIKG